MRRGLLALLLSVAWGGGEAVATPSVEAGVIVYRGPGSGPLPAPPASAAEPTMLAGERLWVVDPETGRTVACRLESTAMVDGRRIVCAARDLKRR